MSGRARSWKAGGASQGEDCQGPEYSTTQARQCLRFDRVRTRVEGHQDVALHPRRVSSPPVRVRHSAIDDATATLPLGCMPTTTPAKFYTLPQAPVRTTCEGPGYEKEPLTRKESVNPLLLLLPFLAIPVIAVLLILFCKGCCLATYLFIDLPRRQKARHEWEDSTKGMNEKQLASRSRMAEARTQLYGYVRDCEQSISRKEYNRRHITKYFRNLEKDNKRTQRQKELRVQRNLQNVVRTGLSPSDYVIVNMEHQEDTSFTVVDAYIDNSHPTPRTAIVLTADGPPPRLDTSPSPPGAPKSPSSSPYPVVSESCSSSSPSSCPPGAAQSPSSSPCSVVSESSSSPSPPRNLRALSYPSSTVTGCSSPPIDDDGTSRAITVPWASKIANVGTPSISQPLSTVTRRSSLSTFDHGASHEIVPRTSSFKQLPSLSTIFEESASSDASGSQPKGFSGTMSAKHGSCPLCRSRDPAPPPPPSPYSSSSSSWSSCSCSCSLTSSGGTPSPPMPKPPLNSPVHWSAASRRGAGKTC